MNDLLTEADLAERLAVDLDAVKAMRVKHKWEHVRLGRYIVRYTETQAQRIVAAHTVKSERPAALPEQTDLSARRAS